MTRPCWCGCGKQLTPRQRRYASRACTQRALWADPAQQAKRIAALRAAKARTRVSVWLRRASVTQALAQLEARVTLDRQDLLVVQAVVARVARQQYAQGYRAARAVEDGRRRPSRAGARRAA